MIFPMYIDGKWFEGEGRQMQDVISPGSGEVLGRIPLGTPEDADAALQAAKKAAPALAAMTVFERAEICYRIANKIDENQEELAKLLTAEHGKPYHSEALGEVAACALAFRDAAEQIKWMDGKVVALRDKDARCLVTRRPKGIFAVITPWNFPLGTACQYYLAAGIAVGDPMVWNPATTTAAVASALMKCFEGVGLPAGAVNLVIGKGSVVGDALSAHPLTAGIGFTGSTVTGNIICERAKCKHTSMELGGDGPCIVLKDADLDVAAQGLMNGSFLNAGQVCTSTERVLVDDAIADALVAKILEKMQTQYQLGDPFDEKTTMGPMHLESQIEIVESHIKQAVEKGAKVVAGALGGVDPSIMGVGPVAACKKVFKKTGLGIDDFDLIEANEAFAAQALAVGKELKWDADKVNVNGGAIALGHPVGASGCRILVTLLHEMQKRDAKRGLATLCIGGGMGCATIVEKYEG